MTVAFLRPLAPMLDAETRLGSQQAQRTGRSWWAVRFSHLDGWIHEWDVDPGSPNGHADWPRLPKRGRQAVRLYCPNGKFAQLGDSHDASGKLFQFKTARRNFSIGGPVDAPQAVLAHVIGMVHGLNGECVLYAWEPLPPPVIPADAPPAPDEQAFIAKSAEPGLFDAAVVEWNRKMAEYERTPAYRAWAKRFEAWQQNRGGRLIGPIEDNVYRMAYQQSGRLSADVLGLEDGEGR